MKTGLTIKEMAWELLRQSKAKQDYLVNTEACPSQLPRTCRSFASRRRVRTKSRLWIFVRRRTASWEPTSASRRSIMS